MNKISRLAFTLLGVGVGLVFRVVDEISTVAHGETELQYMERKCPEYLDYDWTDGSGDTSQTSRFRTS